MIKELNVHFVLVHLFHGACTETDPYAKFTINRFLCFCLISRTTRAGKASLAYLLKLALGIDFNTKKRNFLAFICEN